MVRVGIISDTHGVLRSEIETVLRDCDYIVHAGDMDRMEILDRLRRIAPVYVVRGNNDRDWARYIPRSQHFSIGNIRFFVVHNRLDIPKALDNYHVIVYGHSHCYSEEIIDGRLWLNPGSCARPRFDQNITMAVMEIENEIYQVKKILLPFYPVSGQ